MANPGFHPEALLEYSEAARYYLREASVQIADHFAQAVESAVAGLAANPTRWRILESREIRRCVLNRFPFVIYYRCEPQEERVTIYAVMHTSREPGYWCHRVERSD